MKLIDFIGTYAIYIILGAAVIAALPASPLTGLKTFILSNRGMFSSVLAWVNWFLPISEMTPVLGAYLGICATMQILMIALKATHLVG